LLAISQSQKRREKRLSGQAADYQDDPAARVAEHQAHLSIHSHKTTSIDKCLEALVLTTLCWADMFAFYGSRNVARERFSVAQRKQRTIAHVLEQIVPAAERHNTIVVLGSARFATSMKGSRSTPIRLLVRELSKVCRVVLVDEYFTTQMCSGCNLVGVGSASSPVFTNKCDAEKDPSESKQPLRPASGLRRCFASPIQTSKPHHVHHPTITMASFKRTHEPAHELRRREQQESRRAAKIIAYPPLAAVFDNSNQKRKYSPTSTVIHGLKQCTHCGSYWSRDVGASRNIGWVFIGLWVSGERPVHLRRHTPPPPPTP